MKKILFTLIHLMVLVFISAPFSQQKNVNSTAPLLTEGGSSVNTKYQKWQLPSFFRGYNVLHENPKTQEDFYFLRSTGANIAHIGSFGWRERSAPYSSIPSNIAETDMLVDFCRNAGLYYVIAVRQGPGRTDVYKESNNLGPISTIWTNQAEQQLYADMLKDIAVRYAGDPLFMGINMIVEPNPLWYNFFCLVTPEQLAACLASDGINMKNLFELFINNIRTADPELPLIVENVQFSTPNYFSIIEPVNDPYVIYDVHSYIPRDYIYAETPNSMTYPENYINYPYFQYVWHDKAFIRDVIFQHAQALQNQTGAPILLGEFGLMLAQNNGPQFLKDVSDIAIEKGWHFALWNFRPGGNEWDYELMGPAYWNTVLNMFNTGTVTDLLLYNQTVNSGQNLNYYASNSITAINYVISGGASVSLTSANIYLKDGFSANDGSSFTAELTGSDNPVVTAEKQSKVSSTPVQEDKTKLDMPAEFSLSQNYPNPFNPVTTISYTLKERTKVSLVIYDISGRIVKTLVNNEQSAGYMNTMWDGKDNYGFETASGVYFYKLIAGDFIETKKMVLLK